jgi:hypothetical protein
LVRVVGEKTLPPRRNRQLKKRLMSPVAKRTNQAPKLPTIQRLLDNALSTAGVFIEAPVYVPVRTLAAYLSNPVTGSMSFYA